MYAIMSECLGRCLEPFAGFLSDFHVPYPADVLDAFGICTHHSAVRVYHATGNEMDEAELTETWLNPLC
jgi:hypothetical protein